MLDAETCYRAAGAKDSRFDGRFFVGVTSTGIYCRPSCPARTPHREHVVFYPSAAAAQQAGLRACKRCHPGAVPGSPEWNLRADLVGRAMHLIADGCVDRDGVAGLAARLGYSTRQLHRQLRAELGATPIALARAQRAETARLLLESTELPISSICYAAGFSSLRQFNDTIREVYARTPSEVRGLATRRRVEPGTTSITLRLSCRTPIDFAPLIEFLAERAVPGVEEFAGGVYRRVLDLPHERAIVSFDLSEVDGERGEITASLTLYDLRDLTAAVARCRRLLDLDADPVAVDALLGNDPLLARLVARHPGRRVPGSVDPVELAVRAVVGQQVSVAGARTVAGRLARAYGRPLPERNGTLERSFPRAEDLAGARAADLPMPAARAGALIGLCEALAAGKVVLDEGVARDEVDAELGALAGIGPWTIAYIRMRALGDPDAFLASDLGVRRCLAALGCASTPAAARAAAEPWRPFRAYGLAHLWGYHPTDANTSPTKRSST